MGFEDKVEQSFARPCCSDERQGQADMRSHLIIVPRGTSFPAWWNSSSFPPIEFDSAWFSCCCGLFPSPSEVGAVNPYAVHDHGQPACQSHNCLFHPAAPGDLHRPGLTVTLFGRRTSVNLEEPFWRAL